MKKKIVLLFLMLVLLFSITNITFAQSNEISVYLDGKKLEFEVQPINIDGSVLVPLRKIFESLGTSIEWNGNTKTITALKGDTNIILTIGAKEAIKNGQLVELSSPAQIIDSNTLVPLRFIGESLGITVNWNGDTNTVTLLSKAYDIILLFPANRYPETAAHIQAAIAKGKSSICTIDRDDADENRKKSLANIPTKNGYDRDEWPMAMCKEGGAGADIEYILPSDNRGAGSFISNKLEAYENGTRVLIEIDNSVSLPKIQEIPTLPNVQDSPKFQDVPQTQVTYKNCTEVKAAGKAPLHRDDPGYSKNLDRDGDGIACEK